jgi:hypothetical protein
MSARLPHPADFERKFDPYEYTGEPALVLVARPGERLFSLTWFMFTVGFSRHDMRLLIRSGWRVPVWERYVIGNRKGVNPLPRLPESSIQDVTMLCKQAGFHTTYFWRCLRAKELGLPKPVVRKVRAVPKEKERAMPDMPFPTHSVPLAAVAGAASQETGLYVEDVAVPIPEVVPAPFPGGRR